MKMLAGLMTIFEDRFEDEILLKQQIKIQCLQTGYLSCESIELFKPIAWNKKTQYKIKIDFDSS